MSIDTVIECFAAGSALVAFWLVTRFRVFGPQRLWTAFLATLMAFGLQPLAVALVGPTTSAAGPPAALLLIVFPTLVVMFWATGCLMRAFVRILSPF